MQSLGYWREHNTLGHRVDAVTGPVMTTVCSGTNLRPCSVLLSSSTLHKKLTKGIDEAPLPDFFALMKMKQIERPHRCPMSRGFSARGDTRFDRRTIKPRRLAAFSSIQWLLLSRRRTDPVVYAAGWFASAPAKVAWVTETAVPSGPL
jgi:hypothetical protein